MGRIVRRLLAWCRWKEIDREIDAELAFHFDMRRRALEAEGLPPDDARRQARLEIGQALRWREDAREVWIARWIDQLTQDARYAIRSFRRQPGFTAAVIGTLALGIGANAAIFSVVDALLLRQAPFLHADRLLLIHAARPAQHESELPLSYPNFVDLRSRAQAFSGVGAWLLAEATVMGAGAPDQVQTALVTSNLFDVLGTVPALGRTFRPDEDQPGTAPVVLISHPYWTTRFARSAGVVGTVIQLDGEPHTIVGVLPETFRFAGYPRETAIWRPLGLDKFQDRRYARGLSTFLAVARLRDGVSLQEAERDVAAIAATLEHEYPDSNRGRTMSGVLLTSKATSRIRPALAALTVSVVVVLLIACANVVNLLLGRATARRHELAIRAVLGGSRRRIASQLLVEHVVLAVAGGIAGLGVAAVAQRWLSSLPYNTADYFTPWVAPLDAIGLDGRVLSFTCVVSLAVAVLIGLLPAMHAPASTGLSMRAGGARVTVSRSTMRVRSVLVVAEIAMAAALLVGMSLMLTSITRLLRVNPGFAPDGVTAVTLSLPASRYATGAAVAGFYSELTARLRRTPGISSAGAVETLPFSGIDPDTGLLFEGRPIPPAERRPRAHYRAADEGYFETMGMGIVEGRAIGARDTDTAAPVAVINETAAKAWFPDGHALTRRVALDFDAMRYFPDRPPVFDLPRGLRDVIGIVKDARQSALTDAAQPELYVPVRQRPERKMTLVVRSPLSPTDVASAIRAAVASLDPEQPVPAATTLADLIAASTSRPRFNTMVITAFGVLALTLAAIGIYGVMSYFVTIRRREIAICVAIGATRGDVFRLVTRPMLAMAAVGLTSGLAIALAAAPVWSRLLFDVQPRDPAVFGAVALTVIMTAAAATLGPAIRAVKIDGNALHAE